MRISLKFSSSQAANRVHRIFLSAVNGKGLGLAGPQTGRWSARCSHCSTLLFRWQTKYGEQRVGVRNKRFLHDPFRTLVPVHTLARVIHMNFTINLLAIQILPPSNTYYYFVHVYTVYTVYTGIYCTHGKFLSETKQREW